MTKLHAKSPCCQSKVVRFGGRRRQCFLCKKTWRVRTKKMGRKKKRVSEKFLLSYLHHEIPSLCGWSKKSKQSADQLGYRLKKSRQRFLAKTAYPTLPEAKPLIILADAMVSYMENSWYTFYFILVKEVGRQIAFVTQPYVSPGTETALGWETAFSKIPKKTLESVIALVSDGHRGLVRLADINHWLLQRCHFHLIARLQTRRSKWHLSRHGEEGKRLYGLIHQVLNNPSEKEIALPLKELHLAGKLASGELKTILLGFCRNFKDYRTYLDYPRLNLPKTNNAAESLVGCVWAIRNRARGFRTINSLTEWIETLLKSKQTITCRGNNQPT